eukprot:s1_g580.t1
MSCNDKSIFEDLFDHAFDAQWILSADMVIEHANAAAAMLTGYQVEDLIGQPLSLLLPPKIAEAHDDYVAQYHRHGATHGVLGKSRRFEVQARDGSLIPIQLKAFRLGGGSTEGRFGATMVDLRAQVRLEQEQLHTISQLKRLALIDPLTELWNRRAFDEALDRQTALVSRHHSMAALAMIDIDHFKRVNDTYGHAAGDKVLQLLAIHLKQCVRKEDMCARLGGEEFGVLMPACDSASAVLVIERALQRVATDHFDLTDGRTISISFSAGVAPIEGGVSAPKMLERADAAMYHAKESGRARVVLWEPQPEPAAASA